MARKKIAQKFIGKTIGRLTVLDVFWIKKKEQTRSIAICLCSCGNKCEIQTSNLQNGTTKSCGCLRNETASTRIGMMLASNKSNGRTREPKLASAAKIFQSNYSDGDLSFEIFLELTQRNCVYCGIPPNKIYNVYKNQKFVSPERVNNGDFYYNGLDRIDNSKPHDKNNVVSCCHDCNIGKFTKSKSEFLDWVKRVYKFNYEK